MELSGSSVLDILHHIIHQLADFDVSFEQLLHLGDRVEDGGVVSAAKEIADLLDGEVRQLSGDVNRDMPRVADIGFFALLLGDVLRRHAVGTRYLVDNTLDGHLRRHVVIEHVRDDLLYGAERRLFIIKEGFRLELFDGAFQLSDIALELVGDIFADLIGKLQIQQLGFSLDDDVSLG